MTVPGKGGAPLQIPLRIRPRLDALDADPYIVINKIWLYVADSGAPGRIHMDELPAATTRLLPKARLQRALVALMRPEFEHNGETQKLWLDLVDDHIVLPAWWLDENPPADLWHDDVERMTRKRYKHLYSPACTGLREKIKHRDRNLCRYCGIRVKWDVHNADHGGTFDHVDPDDPENTLSNVVVSCRRCNGRKGHRTPEQWIAEDPKLGLSLLPSGTTAADAAAVRARGAPPGQTRPKQGSTQVRPRSNLSSRTGATPSRVEPEPNPSRTRPATSRSAPPRPDSPRSASSTGGRP